MYLTELISCWQTVEIRTRMFCRQIGEWWNGNEYVKMEDKGTGTISGHENTFEDKDEDEYDIV